MGEFRDIFEAYGADYKTTMVRFLGNETMYLKFLDMMFRDDNFQKLGDALKEGNYAEAFAAAHTLKGVVGNMGLTPYFEAVCAIVEPLRAGESRSDYLEMYQAIRTEYEKAEELRQHLKEGR